MGKPESLVSARMERQLGVEADEDRVAVMVMRCFFHLQRSLR